MFETNLYSSDSNTRHDFTESNTLAESLAYEICCYMSSLFDLDTHYSNLDL